MAGRGPLMASTTQLRAEAGPRALSTTLSCRRLVTAARRFRAARQGHSGSAPAGAASGTAAAAWVGFVAAAAVALGSPGPAQALEAEAVFRNSCAGCHSGGGNIIRQVPPATAISCAAATTAAEPTPPPACHSFGEGSRCGSKHEDVMVLGYQTGLLLLPLPCLQAGCHAAAGGPPKVWAGGQRVPLSGHLQREGQHARVRERESWRCLWFWQ